MGKKSRYREIEQGEQIKWYQWEFLRRNSGYRRDYNAFQAKYVKWLEAKGYWYEDIGWQDEDRKFFWEVILPNIRQICLQWQLYDLHPPDWTFDELGRHVLETQGGGRRYIYLPMGTASGLSAYWDWDFSKEWIAKAAREVSPVVPDPQEEDHPGYLTLRLDVTRPLKELAEEARRAVRFQKRRYEAIVGKKKPDQAKRRRRLDQYATYLLVWDLRQEGRTFKEIAQKVYPTEYKAYQQTPRGYNPILQRVRDHYSQAKELIEQGYKELR